MERHQDVKNALEKVGAFDPDKAVVAITTCDNYNEKALKTATEAFHAPSASVATLRKYLSEPNTRALIWGLIEPVINSINVGRGMNADSIASFIDYIMDEFYFLKLEEIKTFLDMVKLGKLGQFYDRMDLPTLSEMLRKYDEQRTGIAMATAESNKGKESIKTCVMPQDVKALLERLTKPKPQPIPSIAQFAERELTIRNYNFLFTNGKYQGDYDSFVVETHKKLYGHIN